MWIKSYKWYRFYYCRTSETTHSSKITYGNYGWVMQMLIFITTSMTSTSSTLIKHITHISFSSRLVAMGENNFPKNFLMHMATERKKLLSYFWSCSWDCIYWCTVHSFFTFSLPCSCALFSSPFESHSVWSDEIFITKYQSLLPSYSYCERV